MRPSSSTSSRNEKTEFTRQVSFSSHPEEEIEEEPFDSDKKKKLKHGRSSSLPASARPRKESLLKSSLKRTSIRSRTSERDEESDNVPSRSSSLKRNIKESVREEYSSESPENSPNESDEYINNPKASTAKRSINSARPSNASKVPIYTAVYHSDDSKNNSPKQSVTKASIKSGRQSKVPIHTASDESDNSRDDSDEKIWDPKQSVAKASVKSGRPSNVPAHTAVECSDDSPSTSEEKLKKDNGGHSRKGSAKPDTAVTIEPPTKCQNCKCLIIYIIITIITLGSIGLGFWKVNPNRLFYFTDSEGNYCNFAVGQARNLEGLPYLLYANSSDPNSYHKCVAECPTNATTPISCIYDVTPADNPIDQQTQISEGYCFTNRDDLIIVFNQCFSSSVLSKAIDTTNIATSLQNQLDALSRNSSNSWNQALSSWLAIALTAVCAITLSILYFFLVKNFGKIVIYISIALVVAICLTISGVTLWFYLAAKFPSFAQPAIPIVDSIKSVYPNLVLGGACASFAMALGIIVMSVIFRKKINLTIQAFLEVKDALDVIPLTPLFGLMHTIICLGLTSMIGLFWAYQSVNGSITGVTTSNYTIGTVTTVFDQKQVFTPTWPLYATIIAEVISFIWYIWTLVFIVKISNTAISGVITQWFFSKRDVNDGYSRLYWSTYGGLLRSNIGTILVAVILNPIVTVLNLIEMAIRPGVSVVKKDDSVAKKTWFDEFGEKFYLLLSSANRRAYTEIPILHSDYMDCAYSADEICKDETIAKKVVPLQWFRFVALSSVAVGQALITLLSFAFGVIVNYLLRPNETLAGENSYFFTILALISLFIPMTLLGVLSAAADTLFMCYHQDLALNSGNRERPFYMSRRMQILFKLEYEAEVIK